MGSGLSLDPFLQAQCDLAAGAGDGVHRGGGARDRRYAGNAVHERGLADRVAVRPRTVALGRVDHEVAPSAADEVDDRGTDALLDHLPDPLDLEPRRLERGRGSLGGDQGEAEAGERGGDGHEGRLVGVADREEDRAARRQAPSRGALRLRKGSREIGGAGHHLAGRTHLGAEHRVAAREALERQHRRLDAHLRGRPLRRQRDLVQLLAEGEPARRPHEVDAGRLRREGDGPRRPRVRLEHEDLAVGYGELHVQEPDDAEAARERANRVRDLALLGRRERRSR